MKTYLATVLSCCMAVTLTSFAFADNASRGDMESSHPITLAIFGDWPYSQVLLDNDSLLIKSINADKNVDTVIHLGDIHSGSMPCTSANILPAIATSNPNWNQRIFFDFQQFNAPLIYTPGDNEWTDCHKSKEKSSGDPLKELAAVRQLFFAKPGKSLGGTEKRVLSQAEAFDAEHPSDAQFVENVMWMDSRVVFVTINMPGSNNDTLPWSGSFANPVAQAKEVTERTQADIRWLKAAFEVAEQYHAQAVVIALQADMFDPAAVAPGGDGLNAYSEFVNLMADASVNFNHPVLLLNGDSHLYGFDYPLADPNSSTGMIHKTRAVPNLQRITVQGSTNGPAEWLRLTIDPRHKPTFSFTNIAYCKDPLGSCQ